MRAVTTVIESSPLTVRELARAVGAEDQWVLRLVEVERSEERRVGKECLE